MPRPAPARTHRRRTTLLVLAAALAMLAGTAGTATASPANHPLGEAFTRSAQQRSVPRDLLVAVGWSQTHLSGNGGQESPDHGVGIMHLIAGASLDRAARLTGLPGSQLRTQDAASIDGAAALLSGYARSDGLSATDRGSLTAWYAPVEKLAGASTPAAAQAYAEEVFAVLHDGLRTTVAGEVITVTARPGLSTEPRQTAGVARPFAVTSGAPGPDSSASTWYPANPNNYSTADRNADGNHVDYIVIHDTESSWASAISWFQNPASEVSAHFVISRTGQIAQTVRTKDIAYHAGNWPVNVHAIGVEHEGYAHSPGWYTTAEYQASARLVKTLAIRYGVPLDRTHIIGHYQVPNQANGHTDPGPYWNWTYYMSLVRHGATPQQIRGIREPVRTDLNGNGTADHAVYRPGTGQWFSDGTQAVFGGQPGDIPVPGHYSYLGTASRAIFRPSTGTWYVSGRTVRYGQQGDIPVPADYNGDGYTDIAVFRPSTGVWYVLGRPGVRYGQRGDTPVPADYNHDGIDEKALFRPSTGQWFVIGRPAVQYGDPDDVAVPHDYDGDGFVDLAVWRPSSGQWFIRGRSPVVYGQRGDTPVAGDFLAQHLSHIAVWRPSTGIWYVLGVGSYRYGQDGDVPLH